MLTKHMVDMEDEEDADTGQEHRGATMYIVLKEVRISSLKTAFLRILLYFGNVIRFSFVVM